MFGFDYLLRHFIADQGVGSALSRTEFITVFHHCHKVFWGMVFGFFWGGILNVWVFFFPLGNKIFKCDFVWLKSCHLLKGTVWRTARQRWGGTRAFPSRCAEVSPQESGGAGARGGRQGAPRARGTAGEKRPRLVRTERPGTKILALWLSGAKVLALSLSATG